MSRTISNRGKNRFRAKMLDAARRYDAVGRRCGDALRASVHAMENLEPRLLMSASAPDALGSSNISPLWFATVTDSSTDVDEYGSALYRAESVVEKINWLGEEVEAVADQWLVQLNSDAISQIDSIYDIDGLLSLSDIGGRVVEGLGIEGMVLVESNMNVNDDAFVSALKDTGFVATVERNMVIHTDALPDDGLFGNLWGLHNSNDTDIDAVEAWNISTGSDKVIVAVIDTGVDYNHRDLRNNMWVNPGEIEGNGVDDDGNGFVDDVHGYDFVNNDGSPMDDNGHGTHVAGTIGAVGDNNDGVVGVNWDVSIMALKFLSSNGSGFVSHALRAINYATMMKDQYRQNVRVMNNSWGGGGFYQPIENAIEAAADEGILFVAAAGNSGRDNDLRPEYPAGYQVDNVLSVAATDRNDRLASFSNYGDRTVHVAAPGVNILSTMPNNRYGSLSGTSMATPHVAGLAALLWANDRGMTYSEVKDAIMNGVDQVDALAGKIITGGRINAYNAIRGVAGEMRPDRYENNDSMSQVDNQRAGVSNSANLGELYGDTVLSALNTVDDAEDWFKFSMNDRGGSGNEVEIKFDGDEGDLNIDLYREDGTLIDRDTSGTRDVSLSGEAAGTFYVRVWAPDGDQVNYSMTIKPSVDLADAYEENDSRNQVDGRTEGGFESPNLGYVTGNRVIDELNMLDDTEDWYRFRMIDHGAGRNNVSISFNHSQGDLDLAVYRADGTLVGTSYSVSNGESVSLKGEAPGIYYVKAYGYNGATNPAYTLKISAPNGPRDGAGNDPSSAKTIKNGRRGGSQTITEMVGFGDAADYYAINVSRGGHFDLDVSELSGDLDIELVDFNGQTIASVSGASAMASGIAEDLEAGRYYIAVTADGIDPANYTLTTNLREVPPSRADDSTDEARGLGRGRRGRNVTEMVGFGDDADYYLVNMKRDGRLDLLLTDLTEDADLRLIDGDGNTVTRGTSSGTSDATISETLAQGRYYVVVEADDNDMIFYALQSNMELAPKDRAGESIDTARGMRGRRGSLRAGEAVGMGDSADYYRFNVKWDDTSVTLSLSGLDADADLRLYDADGNQVDSSTRNGTADETINEQLDAGTYYIAVTTSSDDLITYNLQVDMLNSSSRSRSNSSTLAQKQAAMNLLASKMKADASRVTLQNAAGQVMDDTGSDLLSGKNSKSVTIYKAPSHRALAA